MGRVSHQQPLAILFSLSLFICHLTAMRQFVVIVVALVAIVAIVVFQLNSV